MSPVSPVFNTIETVTIFLKFKRNKLLQSRDLNVHVRIIVRIEFSPLGTIDVSNTASGGAFTKTGHLTSELRALKFV